MKTFVKRFIFLGVIATCAVAAQAQIPGVAGSWLMTTAEMKGKVSHPYQTADFRKDGKLAMMGIEVGNWKVDPKANRLIFQSKMDKDFNGAAKIIKLTANELVIDKDGSKFYYSRVDHDAITQANKNSGLAGDWNILDSEYPVAFLKFTLPDTFVLYQASANETDERQGTWIFNPKENSIIFIGFSHLLRGKHQIIEHTADQLKLKSNGKTIRVKRFPKNLPPIERLSFKEDDFPEDQDENSSRLPWQDFDQMADFLSGIASVQYRRGTLVEKFHTMAYTRTILSRIKTNAKKPGVEFTNLSISEGDTSQFSQNYKGGLSGRYNNFFPKDELQPYRILGTEKITVPAGTFLCTVVEGFDSDKKVKYWMINEMPGIYAKIIEEEIDPFNKLTYQITELEKINKGNNP